MRQLLVLGLLTVGCGATSPIGPTAGRELPSRELVTDVAALTLAPLPVPIITVADDDGGGGGEPTPPPPPPPPPDPNPNPPPPIGQQR